MGTRTVKSSMCFFTVSPKPPHRALAKAISFSCTRGASPTISVVRLSTRLSFSRG